MNIFDFSDIDDFNIKGMHCIYLLHAVGSNFYKIGFAKNLKQRISNMQSGCPFRINLVNCSDVPNHREVEKYLHDKYSEFRSYGEWFEFNEIQVDEIQDIFSEIGDSLRKKIRGL